MDITDTISEEIIIVGSRYGKLADVLNPLYKEGETIEEKEIIKMLGGDMVLLHPTQNRYDQYAVGVYTLSQQLLGFVWMCQSPSICDWLDDNHKEYIKAHIRQVNTKFGIMMAMPDKPVKLKYRERTSFSIDLDWASNCQASPNRALGWELPCYAMNWKRRRHGAGRYRRGLTTCCGTCLLTCRHIVIWRAWSCTR